MRKHHSRFLTVLVLVFFCCRAFAQQIDSMMNVYADRLPPEKIHIHFDKTGYNRGETVWYKIYILQRGDTASHNIYLEWYDAEGKLLTHTVAPLLLSTSQGSFDIPMDYKGEVLQIKAYTRWMLNDDPAFSYRRELMVNTNSAKKTKPVSPKTTVETFPEGGYLIEGLHTRVAFKATNPYGNPVFIRGVLMDDGTRVDSLRIQHDGMGSFYCLPQPGHVYTLNWTDENGVAGSTVVPVTKTTGARLAIQTRKGKALFQVQRTENIPDNFRRMILLVHMNHVLVYRAEISTTEKNKLNGEVPIDTLPTGLLQFTLFTSDWIPVAERVIFINNRSHAFDVKLTAPLVSVDKRGKNVMEVFVPDTLFTNMSLSVTDASISVPDQHTIFSDILLSSEIKGKINNPGYYFSGETDSIAAHLDLIMLTHGWRRFDWEKIRAGIPPEVDHPVESGYMKLTGKVSGLKKNSEPVELNLVVLDKDSSRQFLSVPVEKDGSFDYPLVLFDTAKVFFSFSNKLLPERVRLQMNNNLSDLPHRNIQPVRTAIDIWNDGQAKDKLDVLLAEEELLRKKKAETTLKEVTVTATIKTRLEQLNDKYSTGFFRAGPTRKEYILDLTDAHKPTSARNVLEYLQSKIPGLIFQSGRPKWRGDEPLFYLNEMKVDLETIVDIPLLNVAIIKAFPPLFMFQAGGGAGGAIAVYTRMGDDTPPREIKGLPSMLLSGYTRFKEFYHPSYESKDEEYTQSDNRTTLYWNHSLITNASQQRIRIEFFNNDFTKSFNMVLEGVNAEGKMTRLVRTIDVSAKPE